MGRFSGPGPHGILGAREAPPFEWIPGPGSADAGGPDARESRSDFFGGGPRNIAFLHFEEASSSSPPVLREEVGQRAAVESSEGLQFDNVHPPLARLALRDEGLRPAEVLRDVVLGHAALLTGCP